MTALARFALWPAICNHKRQAVKDADDAAAPDAPATGALGGSSARPLPALLASHGALDRRVVAMEDTAAAHLAAACSRSALHPDAYFPLLDVFPDTKLIRLSFGLQNKVMISISVNMLDGGSTHCSYVPIHPTAAAAAVLQNNPVVVVRADKRSPLWDQEDLYQRESCTTLNVVSMPFYWPPRAGSMWDGLPLPVPQNPAFHPTFGALTTAGDGPLSQEAMQILLDLAARVGRHVGPHISMLLSSLESSALLPSEVDAQEELGSMVDEEGEMDEGEMDALFKVMENAAAEADAVLPGLRALAAAPGDFPSLEEQQQRAEAAVAAAAAPEGDLLGPAGVGVPIPEWLLQDDGEDGVEPGPAGGEGAGPLGPLTEERLLQEIRAMGGPPSPPAEPPLGWGGAAAAHHRQLRSGVVAADGPRLPPPAAQQQAAAGPSGRAAGGSPGASGSGGSGASGGLHLPVPSDPSERDADDSEPSTPPSEPQQPEAPSSARPPPLPKAQNHLLESAAAQRAAVSEEEVTAALAAAVAASPEAAGSGGSDDAGGAGASGSAPGGAAAAGPSRAAGRPTPQNTSPDQGDAAASPSKAAGGSGGGGGDPPSGSPRDPAPDTPAAAGADPSNTSCSGSSDCSRQANGGTVVFLHYPWTTIAFQPASVERAFAAHFGRTQQRTDLAVLAVLSLGLFTAAALHLHASWPAGVAAVLLFAPYFVDARLYNNLRDALLSAALILLSVFLSSLRLAPHPPPPATCGASAADGSSLLGPAECWAGSGSSQAGAAGQPMMAGFGICWFVLHTCGLDYLLAAPMLVRLRTSRAFAVQAACLAMALDRLPGAYAAVLGELDPIHVLLLGLLLVGGAWAGLSLGQVLECRERDAWMERRRSRAAATMAAAARSTASASP